MRCKIAILDIRDKFSESLTIFVLSNRLWCSYLAAHFMVVITDAIDRLLCIAGNYIDHQNVYVPPDLLLAPESDTIYKF